MTKSNIRRALFPGSFNPFTVGHYDIVERALTLFDEVVIGVGYNIAKSEVNIDERIEPIRRLYEDEPRVIVMPYSTLTAEFASDIEACAIVRGIRSAKDFEYERDMADINARLAPIETVVLFARPDLAPISSSVVRELMAYGHDVSQFIPRKPK